MQADDSRWMDLALRDAARGLGRVAPNPAVGCVIVKDGRLLARARTADGGRPHAETQALAQAGDTARGATAYVTLEPCAHTGATGPCCDALVAAGIARVVYPIRDPDNRVAGRGFQRLRDAGVAVDIGLMAAQATELNAGFIKTRIHGLPFVTLKLATSLDGRIATASGESRWITGSSARQYLHLMRARHDAVLVGGGTARADDPLLNVRIAGVVHRTIRVVASATLDLPRDGRLANSVGHNPLWLMHGPNLQANQRDYWHARGARLFESVSDSDPTPMLRELARHGVTRVLCEGGGMLASSLLRFDLVDTVAIFTAGLVLGADGVPAIGALGLPGLADHPRLRLHDVQQIGSDTLTTWRAAPPNFGV